MATESAVPGKVDQTTRRRHKEYFSFRRADAMAQLVRGVPCVSALVSELPADAFLSRGWGSYRPDRDTADLVVYHLALIEAARRVQAPVVLELLYDDEVHKGCGKLHERGTRVWILLEHAVKPNEFNAQLMEIAAPPRRESDEHPAKRAKRAQNDANDVDRMLQELEARYGRRCGYELLTLATLTKGATMWCMGDAGHVDPDKLMLGVTPTTIDDWEEGGAAAPPQDDSDNITGVLRAERVLRANRELGKYDAWNVGKEQQDVETYLSPASDSEGWVFEPGAEIAADAMRVIDWRRPENNYIRSANDLLRFAGFLDVPTKDEMADYLEAYAERFALPIRLGTVVDRVGHIDGRYVVRAGRHRWTADNVVVAMSGFQRPHVPAFAEQLDERIVQVHSAAYRAPDQVGTGTVLVVGAGNSGSEVCMDLARAADSPRRIVLSGRDTGHIPFRIESPFGRTVGVRFVLRFVFRRILSVNSPVGRRKRPEILSSGGPLIRVRNHELAAAGVERAPRVDGVVDGRPRLADGRILDVDAIVWCTGFDPVFPWIDLPVHGDREPRHTSGVADDQPGLYFLGLLFLHTMASEMIHGVGADAARLARHLDQRMRSLSVDDRRVAATA